MPFVMDCLRGLVGLSPDNSFDYGQFAPEYRTSSLNLWAWNLVGPELLANGRMDPSESDINLVDQLTAAYETALATLPKELAGFLGSRLQPVFTPYTGRIGEVGTTGITAVTGSVAGYALPTRKLVNGTLTIKKLGCLLNARVDSLKITVTRYEGPLSIKPTSNLKSFLESDCLKYRIGEVLKIWDIDVKPHDARMYDVSPLKLPLDGSIYVISYQVTNEFFPLNNQLSCGCGGKDKNIDLMLTTPLRSLNGDQAHGLLLEITAACDYSGVVCDLLENNQYTAALGYLLYYKTGLIVLEKVLGGELSPATQISKDDLKQKRADWEGEMSKYLTWMTTEWKPDLLPDERCYLCNTPFPMYRGTLSL